MLTTPPGPMLPQLDSRLARGDRWAYEPKMDGFRGLLWQRDGAAQLLSRSGRDLGPWFPELTAAAESLPRNTLVDGEIVIADAGGPPDQQADLVPANLSWHQPKRTATDSNPLSCATGRRRTRLAAQARLQLAAVQEYQFAFGQQLDRKGQAGANGLGSGEVHGHR